MMKISPSNPGINATSKPQIAPANAQPQLLTPSALIPPITAIAPRTSATMPPANIHPVASWKWSHTSHRIPTIDHVLVSATPLIPSISPRAPAMMVKTPPAVSSPLLCLATGISISFPIAVYSRVSPEYDPSVYACPLQSRRLGQNRVILTGPRLPLDSKRISSRNHSTQSDWSKCLERRGCRSLDSELWDEVGGLSSPPIAKL